MPSASSPEYDVFVSYSRADEAAVTELKAALVARGVAAFLDKDDLVAGMPWPQALEQGLRATRSVVVVIGRDGVGPWQKREMWFALDRQASAEHSCGTFPVIPVLLPGADPTPGFLFSNTWVDFRKGGFGADGLEALVRAIRLDGGAAAASSRTSVCPYRGLRSFREEDAGFYFGREIFAGKLRQRVHGDISSTHVKVAAVVGASGSGKSSLVFAGLLPLLRRQRPPNVVWDAVSFTPRERPWRALAEALLPLMAPDLSSASRIQEAGSLARDLERGEGALESAVRASVANQEGTDRLLLIVDQFEEIFTLSDIDRTHFVDVLLESTRTAPVTVLLTLRADFYGLAVGCHRPLSDALETGQINLGPLNDAELADAIEEPAKRVGLRFEPGLAERIVRDVQAQPGSLPLLEYALAALWRSRAAGQLTHAAYLEMGGIAGAIATVAEEVFVGLAPDLQEAARRVFQRLIRAASAGDDGGDTRRRARFVEIGAADWVVVERFAAPAVRLLVISRDEESGEQTAELAHEATIRAWTRLRAWIDDDRKFLLWRQWLAHALIEWSQAGNPDDLLLRGERLREANAWVQERQRDLSEQELRFIVTGTSDDFHIRQIVLAGRSLAPFANSMSGTRWVLALLGAAEREQLATAATAIKDPDVAVTALCAAAEACWQAGRRDEASEIAKRALEPLGRMTYDHVKEPFVVRLLPILVGTDGLDAALGAVHGFEVPEQRSGLLVRLADVLTSAGSPERAEAVRREAFGFAQQMLAAAALGDHEDERSRAAATFANAGFVLEAESAMRARQDLWPAMLQGALDVLAREGRVDEAIAAVCRVDSEERSKLLRLLAVKLAERGNPRTVDVIRHLSPESDTYEIWQAAAGLAREGLIGEAIKAAELAGHHRVAAYDAVIEALAHAGRGADAVELSSRIDDNDGRARVLGRLTRNLVDSGHPDSAVSVIQPAIASLEASGLSHDSQSAVMGDVAYVFAKIGRIAEAMAAAQRVVMIDRRVWVLASVADTAARLGRLEEARTASLAAIRLAREQGRSEVRYTGRVRSAAALALARAGFLDDALATAADLLTASDQGVLIVRMGLVRAFAGDAGGGRMLLDRALSLVETPSSDTTRAAWIVPAAAVLAAALRQYQFARELVERCRPEARLDAYASVLRIWGWQQHPELRTVGMAHWRAIGPPGQWDISELENEIMGSSWSPHARDRWAIGR